MDDKHEQRRYEIATAVVAAIYARPDAGSGWIANADTAVRQAEILLRRLAEPEGSRRPGSIPPGGATALPR